MTKEPKPLRAREWCINYGDVMSKRPYLEIGETHSVVLKPKGHPAHGAFDLQINDSTFSVSEAKALATWINKVCD